MEDSADRDGDRGRCSTRQLESVTDHYVDKATGPGSNLGEHIDASVSDAINSASLKCEIVSVESSHIKLDTVFPNVSITEPDGNGIPSAMDGCHADGPIGNATKVKHRRRHSRTDSERSSFSGLVEPLDLDCNVSNRNSRCHTPSTPSLTPRGSTRSSRSTPRGSTSSDQRRICFPPEDLLLGSIQEEDNDELWKLLNGSHEFDLNAVNHTGLTPVHMCVINDNIDAVKMLYCAGADVNITDMHDFSPLHTAAACGYLQLCSLLIIYGADVYHLTSDGDLPVDVAREYDVIAVLTNAMLERHHADTYTRTWLHHHAAYVCSICCDTFMAICRWTLERLSYYYCQWARQRNRCVTYGNQEETLKNKGRTSSSSVDKEE